MFVDGTEITLHTGEDMPHSGARPYVDVGRKGEGCTHIVKQLPNGKFHSEIELSQKELTAVRQMFTRYNTHCAHQLDGTKALGKMWRRFPGETMTVGLISCSDKKRDVPSPAKDLYLGELFKKSRRWAELYCDDWAILSAKHRLVLPNKVLEPYDQKMTTRDEDLRYWSSTVSFDCYMQWGEDTHYYLLCGEAYRSPWEMFNNRKMPYTSVLKGLGIGEQMSWLNEQLKNAGAAPSEQEEGKPRRLRLKAPAKAKRL